MTDDLRAALGLPPEPTNFQEWVEAWERGQSVWSIEMGGLGPGYEQAIQITAFRIARHLLDASYTEADFAEDKWPETRERLYAIDVSDLGLSGAQFGAACNLALCVYRRGRDALSEDEVKDRRIQVSTRWPGATAHPAPATQEGNEG